MNYADVEFNGILGSSMKIYAVDYPAIPAAQERITEKEVPGRNGKLYCRTGNYEPTEISVDFNYIGKPSEWNEKWREAKDWLSVRSGNLSFADDTEYFYKIKKVIINANERKSEKIGRFNAVFVTEDGLSYLKNGASKMAVSSVKNNPGIECRPEYYISGTGVCKITVNGKMVTANVSGNIVINTELQLSYKEDGTAQNTAITGEYDDLLLQPGTNSISVTSGFDCQIIPNWRRL